MRGRPEPVESFTMPSRLCHSPDVTINAASCQQYKALQFDILALAFGEEAVMGVAGAAGKLDGFGEVQADLVGGMGVGAEGDGHAELGGKVDDADRKSTRLNSSHRCI